MPPAYHAAGRGGAGAVEGTLTGRVGRVATRGAERGCGVTVGMGLLGSVASKVLRSLRWTLGVVGGEGGGALLVGGVCGRGELVAGGAAAPGGGVGRGVVRSLVARVRVLAGVRGGRR